MPNTVTSVDWSDDPDTIQISTVTPSYHALNVATSSFVESKDKSRSWASYSATYSQHTVGVWQNQVGGKQPIRSLVPTTAQQPISASVRKQQDLIVVGHQSGSISLFRFPCPANGAYSHSYTAHKSPATVRFSADGANVISIGKSDCAVYQWKVD